MERCSNDMSFQFEDFVLKESIWLNIEKLCNTSEERSELKKAIGESLVDETLDLHREVTTLHGIWKEYHEQINNIVCETALPEPPFMRDNLEKQISLLVELLQQKIARQGGRPISAVLTDDERNLIKNVSTVNKKKRSSSVTSSNRETPSSGYDSRCSSVMSIDLNTLQDNINVMEMERFVQPLRDDFEDERKLLLSDIQHIQDALIHENEEQNKTQPIPSPTLKDLRSLSTKLEKEVLQEEDFKIASASLSHEEESKQTVSSPKSRISKKISPIPPSTHRRSHGNSLNPPGKLIATRTFSYPVIDRKNDHGITGVTEVNINNSHLRKKMTPSPPSGDRTNNKPSSISVSKFRKHVTGQKEVMG